MEKPKQKNRASQQGRFRRKALETLEGYLYLAPTLIILMVFVFIPIISSFQLSLNRAAPFGNQTIYVGLENYERLLTDPVQQETIWISILFTIGTVIPGIILSVMLAILLSLPVRRFSWLHRLLIFVPIVISSAVTGVLFRWIYHPVVGYINYILSLVGIDGPNWLSDPDWALIAIMIAVIWRQLGFNVIIALAGLQNIDSTYYEAAKVDGASLWDRIVNITIPLMSPTLFFLFIINTITSLQVFGEIDVLTRGETGTSTLLYSIYDFAFRGTPQRGIASAQSFILFVLIIVLSIIQFRIANRRVYYQ